MGIYPIFRQTHINIYPRVWTVESLWFGVCNIICAYHFTPAIMNHKGLASHHQISWQWGDETMISCSITIFIHVSGSNRTDTHTHTSTKTTTINYYDRRKFRSETSDNMDSWKAEVRRVRREKIRRKKMQMREKVGKSVAIHCVFSNDLWLRRVEK